MSKPQAPHVAIVDYGLGNLYSVKHACSQAGLQAVVTVEKSIILNAGAIILPGVGAFGDAMKALHQLDLVDLLRDIDGSSKPLIGICLGFQLLMTVSYEFGKHEGLDLIDGAVERFEHPKEGECILKVPHVGWNRIHKTRNGISWKNSFLDRIRDGEYMYFVHSFYAQPNNPDIITSTTNYGDVEFCSSVKKGNVFGCQFHPERSGPKGLKIYRNLASYLKNI